jgi:hypothetical protein
LKIHKILEREPEEQRCKTRNVACHSAAPYVRRVIRIWCVSLAIFALVIIGSVGADDFPIKKFSSFTWVVDYEPFWSPDSRQIVLVSSRHGGMKVHVMQAALIVFPVGFLAHFLITRRIQKQRNAFRPKINMD